MEKTLDTVLRSIGNPGLSSIASGMVSRSPSPSNPTIKTQELLETPSPPPPHHATIMNSLHRHPGSPRLHSLPDNELNPLGLLAEASLANRRAQSSSQARSKSENASSDPSHNVGVASDLYFKPGLYIHIVPEHGFLISSTGPMTILPLRRLYIERQIQPEMLNFVSTDEVVALFKM